ncbi:putative Nitrilase and fragile histidine triad fusion protein NitFhit [Blattamonas nauphoetae]|uniref:Nitrilase and fragile histidine triad fusion protein NitFhit n=1 Tax=Blattamonas nauphoetae TaxID=2049346 RepID=A0ABQ9XI05_9EUKA|nr:putative Nitrilase and fragile histidine triad fusion protein NitFhit [Blattamonas nauphoetae]
MKSRRILKTTSFHFSNQLLIPSEQIFFITEFSFAFVNIKPIVPGHILISPQRIVQKFADLTTEEASDMFLLAKHITPIFEQHFGTSSTTLTIQDGPDSGQSIPHVHLHLIPRTKHDPLATTFFEQEIEKPREPRSLSLMERETLEFRKLFIYE